MLEKNWVFFFFYLLFFSLSNSLAPLMDCQYCSSRRGGKEGKKEEEKKGLKSRGVSISFCLDPCIIFCSTLHKRKTGPSCTLEHLSSVDSLFFEASITILSLPF